MVMVLVESTNEDAPANIDLQAVLMTTHISISQNLSVS